MRPVISLLLPTRGRPTLVDRLFNSIAATASDLTRVEVVLYVDLDDQASHNLASSAFRVEMIVGPRMAMGSCNTACLERSTGAIVILANDDMVMRTPGWDERIDEVHAEFKDEVYLAYPNDLFKNRAWCTFPIMSRRTCRLLEQPYPKAYRGAFIDSHLVDIFQRLKGAKFDRIRYLDDVIFEHMHYRVGKATFDETYSSRDRFVDDATFLALAPSRSASAKRLRSAIEGRDPEELPDAATCSPSPVSVLSAVKVYTSKFLLDTELPIRWRVFLWYWFIGRYFAARGLLGPLRGKR